MSALGLLGVDSDVPFGRLLGCGTDSASPFCESADNLPVFASFVAVFCLYALVTSWRTRNIPISSLNLTMHVFMTKNSRGEPVMTVIREQCIRAHRRGVSAYYSTTSPTRGGTVPKESFALKIRWKGYEKKQRQLLPEDDEQSEVPRPPRLFGSDDGGWEVIQEFGADLPYFWYSPLIPSILLREGGEKVGRIRRSLSGRYAGFRKGVNQYVNDFSDNEGEIDVSAPRYRQERVILRIYFRPTKMEAISINQRSVSPVEIESGSGAWGQYSYVRVDRLEGNLRIIFSLETTSAEPIPSDWARLLPSDGLLPVANPAAEDDSSKS